MKIEYIGRIIKNNHFLVEKTICLLFAIKNNYTCCYVSKHINAASNDLLYLSVKTLFKSACKVLGTTAPNRE